MVRRERWEKILDQLRAEIERMADALDDAAELAHAQEREIVRLQEQIGRLEDELEAQGDPAEDAGC